MPLLDELAKGLLLWLLSPVLRPLLLGLLNPLLCPLLLLFRLFDSLLFLGTLSSISLALFLALSVFKSFLNSLADAILSLKEVPELLLSLIPFTISSLSLNCSSTTSPPNLAKHYI